jgi:hypothetical protein
MFDIFYTGTKPNLFPHEQPADSIEQAQKKSRTRYFWWVTYLVDYAGFDFLWEPVPWQSRQRHAWPSQWQKDSGVYLIPRDWDGQDTNYHIAPTVNRVREEKDRWQVPRGIDTKSFDWTWYPDPTEPPYIYQFGTQHQRTGGPQYCVPGATDIKFVDQIRVQTNRVATAVYEIDHMDGAAGQIPNTTRRVRYFDNYRDTLIRIAKSIGDEHEFVWICSSICDYTNFDFSWHPEQWQASMLHVFASDSQKFGDTFFMHVPTFAHRAEHVKLLEWYDCNFVDAGVPRRPMPVIKHDYDSQVNVVKFHDWVGPLALFTNSDQVPSNLVTVPLWRLETKTIVPFNTNAASAIVPKVAVPYIKTQLYDYPYIDKTHRSLIQPQLQDIVFISYDEPDAEKNWQTLVNCFPRAQRVHGVKGMENALAAAAELSSTPWYFCVFGKTELYPGFDFTFQPDYFQQPKHYIFYSENRVNKLVYGEMAIIMYNCNLILDNRNQEFGLDYTLSFPHEVVPIISTYGNFNTSPYHTWRTAFREVSKLYDMQEKSPSVETEYRIKVWETVAEGDYAEWALIGSRDGRNFYQKYKDDFAYRKNSFNWQWLQNYFSTLHGEIN